MCARYDLVIAQEIYERAFKAVRLPQSNFPPRYNIAPTDQVPIVRIDPRDGIREVVMARWGLIPGLDEGEAQGAAHQRPRRDGSREAFVPRGVRAPALPHPGDRLLSSGSSAPTASSRGATGARTSSRSPSPGFGSSRGSATRTSSRPASSSATRTTSSPACTTACRSSSCRRTMTAGSAQARRPRNCALCSSHTTRS